MDSRNTPVAAVDKRVANPVADHSDHHSDSLARASLVEPAKVPCKRHCQHLCSVRGPIHRAYRLSNLAVAHNPGRVDNL